jgi:hypothetical protein
MKFSQGTRLWHETFERKVTLSFDSLIDAQGDVTEMKLVRGNPLLVTAAFNAVRQRKYQPTLLNGIPVAVDIVHFGLSS